jgi:hypothetical protein
MTPRQQRRLEQKLARKAVKKEQNRASQQPEVLPPPHPISQAKLFANRANAQLSTGAVTPEGKAIVCQNATRHGLTGTFQVLPNESQADFDQLLAAYMSDEAPADQEETQMVQYMAEATWLSRRSVRLQDRSIIFIESGSPEEQKEAKKDLALYLRYMTAHDRAYARYAAELRKRRSERLKRERGFVSQQYREAAERRREENQNQKKQVYELRAKTQILRHERVMIQNRLATAKAERLELRNQAAKPAQSMSAAA